MDRATGWTLTATIAVTPLCLLPGVFLSHDVIPKVIAGLAGAALLLFLLPRWGMNLTTLSRFRRGRWFVMLAVAQILSLILSASFSNQPALSFAGTVWRRFGAVEQLATLVIAVAAACVAATNREWVRSLFRAISITGGLGAIYATSASIRF